MNLGMGFSIGAVAARPLPVYAAGYTGPHVTSWAYDSVMGMDAGYLEMTCTADAVCCVQWRLTAADPFYDLLLVADWPDASPPHSQVISTNPFDYEAVIYNTVELRIKVGGVVVHDWIVIPGAVVELTTQDSTKQGAGIQQVP